MSQDSVLKTKSFEFAVRIINLFKYLNSQYKENVLSRQVLRCGTSVGALIREAEFAESRPDFKHKLNIGLKEANECVYWLELLFTTGYIDKKMFDSLISEAREILRMLVSSLKTIRQKERAKNI